LVNGDAARVGRIGRFRTELWAAAFECSAANLGIGDRSHRLETWATGINSA
jgi:hypothetical protein